MALNLMEIKRAVDDLSSDERQELARYLQQQQIQQKTPTQRRAGLHEHLGHAWMSDDFNAELPESFWTGDE